MTAAATIRRRDHVECDDAVRDAGSARARAQGGQQRQPEQGERGVGGEGDRAPGGRVMRSSSRTRR